MEPKPVPIEEDLFPEEHSEGSIMKTIFSLGSRKFGSDTRQSKRKRKPRNLTEVVENHDDRIDASDERLDNVERELSSLKSRVRDIED